MDKGQKLCKKSKNDIKSKMVISLQKWKIVFLESLMNFKYDRSKLLNFYDFGIALKECEMKIYKKVVFGSIWKKLIFGSFDLEGYFGNYEKFMHFVKKAISEKIVSDF